MIQQLELIDHDFWHADMGILLYNARLQGGWGASASFLQRITPEITTLYAEEHRDREKEEVWENIRQASFSNLPSRLGALYLFINREDLDAQTWWKDEVRTPVLVRVAKGCRLHIADSKLLNALPADWEVNAKRYWSGEATGSPAWEAVLDGPFFIPDIEDYPRTMGARRPPPP